MGGNAMKEFGGQRITTAQMNQLKPIIKAKIKTHDPSIQVSFVQSYFNKETHGDIDVVLNKFVDPSIFGSKHQLRNGNITSFLLEVDGLPPVQVDLIVMTDNQERKFSLGYFAYNDLGNFAGRVAHKLGMKFGHDGLWLPVKDGDHLIAEIPVTKDFHRALSFLGYDVDRYEEGFADLEDIFKFVASSKYFNKDIFLLDNRNAISRSRDAKRTSYSGLLKWNQTADLPNAYPWELYAGRKDLHLSLIFAEFPMVAEQYHAAWSDHLRQMTVKEIISGKVAMEVTKLTGKDLGAFMTYLRNNHAHLFEYDKAKKIGHDEMKNVIANIYKNTFTFIQR